MAVIGLVYWGSISAATDMTMGSIVETPGTRTRQAIIDLITPIAAGIIASDPSIIAAAQEAVDNALSTQLALSKSVHREGNAWIWDGPNGVNATRYVFRESGEWTVHLTPFPVPLATPAFDW